MLDGFDYVALGHLHRAQQISSETVRYAGSPLKYSLSEVKHSKSFTLVTLGEKGQVKIDLIPIKPLRDLRRISGSLENLIAAGLNDPEGGQDYIHAVLTDMDALDPAARLRMVYPNLLHVEIEQQRTELERMSIHPPRRKASLNCSRIFTDTFTAQGLRTTSAGL